MKHLNILSILLLIFQSYHELCAQSDTSRFLKPQTSSSKWYDNVSIRGYTQVRYNRLFESNPELKCEQCDRSWGENGGFFIRRLRVIIYGQISSRVYYYFQPDFASSASSSGLHYGQVRDMYFDVGLDRKNEFRLRIGQSKVPYGFENLQSSQNRLPLDRNDALNSAVSNERDIGVFFYWAPERRRKLFSSLVSSGLKGSGDYGVIGFGLYNGQTANKPELNNTPHMVGRLTYPFELGNQIIEPSVQAFYGEAVLAKDQVSTGVITSINRTYIEKRAAATLVLYPKPFGIQAEYTVGEGPRYDKTNASINTRKLEGGYATLSYLIDIHDQIIIPFSRIQYFMGGKKHELDARSYKVNELEIGAEWQPVRQFELVAMMTFSSRRFEDHPLQNNLQTGRLLRIQAQVNF